MGDGAGALAAPPGGLGIGGNPDRARDIGRVPVSRLHQVMIVASRKEDDLFALGGIDHPPHVGGDLGAAREDAQVDGLQSGE